MSQSIRIQSSYRTFLAAEVHVCQLTKSRRSLIASLLACIRGSMEGEIDASVVDNPTLVITSGRVTRVRKVMIA